MGLLESLATASPAMVLEGPEWADLRSRVEGATRKSELRVVEDQVDAVVCAYVALYVHHRPQDTTTYGDLETGYVVTPTLPPGLVPTKRAARTPDDPVRTYALSHPDLVAAGEEALALVTGILDEAGINYLTVTGRTKTVASFAEKAARRRDGDLLYPDPLTQITDTIGIRVITYVRSDVAAVAELLADQVVVLDDRDMGQVTAEEGRFGYASRHLQIGLDAVREAQPAYAHLRGRAAQVQIRTVRPAARVGGVRARHPLQGPGAGGARPRLRPPVHPGGGPAGARRPGVLHHPRHPARRPGRGAPRPGRRRPTHRRPRAGGVPGGAVRRRRLVAHRPLRLDLRAAARARRHLADRARRGAARRRRGADRGADGLPLPARRGAPPRRRPAGRLRHDLRRAARQRARVPALRARLEKLGGAPDRPEAGSDAACRSAAHSSTRNPARRGRGPALPVSRRRPRRPRRGRPRRHRPRGPGRRAPAPRRARAGGRDRDGPCSGAARAAVVPSARALPAAESTTSGDASASRAPAVATSTPAYVRTTRGTIRRECRSCSRLHTSARRRPRAG